ncbi:MAG: endonuclease III domain-containing protein [Gammaproteobacteria bacterium]
MRTRLLAVFRRLLRHYGAQDWWPADSPFEVIAGAVLTQNTSWSNVERALANLKRHHWLDPATILAVPQPDLAHQLIPAGYFNVKAERLRSVCAWLLEHGGIECLRQRETGALRSALLAVHGIGPETADDILLYAFDRPVFVIDAYTRRILARLGLVRGDESYEGLRALLERGLRADVALFKEYHALLVRHGKDTCRTHPRCAGCCLAHRCPARLPA